MIYVTVTVKIISFNLICLWKNDKEQATLCNLVTNGQWDGSWQDGYSPSTIFELLTYICSRVIMIWWLVHRLTLKSVEEFIVIIVPWSLQECHSCHRTFGDQEKKHHCRGCGEGFCDECTQYTKPVPERGWGPNPVRVCEKCYNLPAGSVAVGEYCCLQ